MSKSSKSEIEFNQVTSKLPRSLHTFIVKQPYSEYTYQNQAVWRYVMRLNIDYLKDVAHKSYIKGLDLTGILIDEIPMMEGMNRILKDIGWAAVAVDGFIPPNAFMEFQAHNVLVISSEIRTIDHIGYTPAPDIIHEAAGHAPIIANPEYSEYLRRFGELGSKAISSPEDDIIYHAIRELSILKENPNSSQKDILLATKKVENIQNNMTELSEMAKIRNLHWWSVEYGLIGDINNPKIYGAGLLSSIDESKECLSPKIKKIPYTIDAADTNFDITATQPHLFVTPTFSHLSYVLEKFANKMSVRIGGLSSVNKLINSKKLGTIQLSTGIQISSVFERVISHDDKPIYIKSSHKTSLSDQNKELIGHGINYHKDGFGSPIGKLEGINIAIEDMSPTDLEAYGIVEGKFVELRFEGGVCVKGKIITGKRDIQGKIQLISFSNCTVNYKSEILFNPDWGIYDMAVGKNVVSVFAGAADDNSFENTRKKPKTKSAPINYSKEELELHSLYGEVRSIRDSKVYDILKIEPIYNNIKLNFTNEWLILLEIYEILFHQTSDLKDKVLFSLLELQKNEKYSNLITNGLRLIK
ncbi:MAG: aromatic amino acid hydroxylase [Flavobacteriaceae bacterium]|nr:aromatic amino acid hydroxylase [Flavobacteriaceae bacterium]